MADELVYNSFYQALQDKYRKKFELAQKKSYLICVPLTDSYPSEAVNEEFVDTHILKPSPYFKGQFISTDAAESKVVELEDGEVKSLSGFKTDFGIKILSEERGYSGDSQPYVIIIVEKPLELSCGLEENMGVSVLAQTIRKLNIENKGISLAQSRKILRLCCNDEVFKSLDPKIEQFNNHYVLLPNFLDDVQLKLKSICKYGSQKAAKNLKEGIAADGRVWALLTEAVESYVLGSVYGKLFTAIAQMYAEEDCQVAGKLLHLHNTGVDAEQLGAKRIFCCPLPAGVVELATLDGLCTPSEKIYCMKNTIDIITAEVKQHLQETEGLLTPSGKLPPLVADDLIPIMLTVISQAKLLKLVSNLHYVENFLWSLSPKDELSYSLITFKAATEYVKMHEFTQLVPRPCVLKKEISLEELMQVTERLQIKENEQVSSANGKSDTYDNWSPADRQLDKITKMIEASTRELSAVEDRGIHRNPSSVYTK